MGGTISSEQVERHMQQLREDAINELRQQLKTASKRVKQLERLNATLAAEVDAQRLVVEAAQHWYSGGTDWSARLATAVMTYEASHKDATHA